MSKLTRRQLLLLGLLLIHLLPIWIFPFIPTQDGPSHVYNASVLRDYYKSGSETLRKIFQINWRLFPNWASHAIMALIMVILPPVVTEKVVLSLSVLAFPLALLYFLNAVDRDRWVFCLIGFLWTYNYLLHMGFYNFTLSMSMFFLVLGYWWKHRDEMSPVRIGILYALLLVTYLCHFVSYLLVLMTIGILALYAAIYEGLSASRETRYLRLREEAQKLLVFIGWMLPAYFILFSYALDNSTGYARNYFGSEWLHEYFFDMKSLVYFRDAYIPIGRLLLWLIAALLLWTFVWRGWQAIRCWRSRSGTSASGIWEALPGPHGGFLLVSIALTILFFKSPWSLGSGGGWINDRIHLYILPVLLPFLTLPAQRAVRYALGSAFIALSLWHLAYTVDDYRYLSQDIAEMVAAAPLMDRPGTFQNRPGEWDGSSERRGKLKYVAPFLHVPGYFGVGKDVAYLNDYEAELDYFPVIYREEAREEASKLPDYILLWKTEYDQAEELEKDYTLLHEGRYNRLYRRNRLSSSLRSSWSSSTRSR